MLPSHLFRPRCTFLALNAALPKIPAATLLRPPPVLSSNPNAILQQSSRAPPPPSLPSSPLPRSNPSIGQHRRTRPRGGNPLRGRPRSGDPSCSDPAQSVPCLPRPQDGDPGTFILDPLTSSCRNLPPASQVPTTPYWRTPAPIVSPPGRSPL